VWREIQNLRSDVWSAPPVAFDRLVDDGTEPDVVEA
jgi:hypothetical protein